jgi:energy-coupling factor transport system substrate-specific component
LKHIKDFFNSVAQKQGIISIIFVIIVCIGLYIAYKKRNKSLSTRDVVAIGIGAALYGALSSISIPIGPNTSFRLAIALLPIFGAIFGPIVGFLVGFIGHALNDSVMYGSVWWSWVFLSATLGLFGGLVTLNPGFDVLKGKIKNLHIIQMYIFSVVGMAVGCVIAFLGDVYLYGESAKKVWLQIVLASSTNLAVMAIIGIPVVIAITRLRSKNNNLEIE